MSGGPSGGPTEEQWKKMSPLAKKVYWWCVGINVTIIGSAFLYKFVIQRFL